MEFGLGNVCVHPGTPQRDTRLFLWHPVCSSRHITARHSPLPLAPCMLIQAHHSKTLTSSSGTVYVHPGTSQRDTDHFLWHRVCSSRHTTARHSPLPLASCVFIQAHHSEMLTTSPGTVCVHPGTAQRDTPSTGTVCVHPSTSQRDTDHFPWHRVCSSTHSTARHSPLPVSVPGTTPNHSTKPSARYRNIDSTVRKLYVDIAQNKILLQFMKEHFSTDGVTESIVCHSR
jgi:hypothetical protein